MKNHNFYSIVAMSIAIGTLTTGCSTVTVNEQAPLPEVPEYVKVPHPLGFEMVDLKAMLLSPMAPKGVLGEFADSCDDDYKKLSATTNSRDDLKKGASELVTRDPERMHWCFYSKLARLQDVLSSDATWSNRQKKVLDTYSFLSPIANAFVIVYQDSRYIRWASLYYTKISEWVFFRKVAPGPENTLMMVNTQHSELEPWVPVKNTGQMNVNSVFEKYGINLAPTTAKPVMVMEETPGGEAPAVAVESQVPQGRTPASVAPSEVSPPVELPAAEAVPTEVVPTEALPTE